jgi:virginiamycin A acetyltransferase
MKAMLKQAVFWLCTFFVLPVLVKYLILKRLLDPSQAIDSSSQSVAHWPGLFGRYLRVAFYHWVLRKCDRSVFIGYGTLFSQPGAMLDENVYIGPRCHLGLVHLQKDVLLGAGVHIPSGGQTHFFDDPDKPIREQGGERSIVTIGAGAWIGSAAVILADVGEGTIVGAGSVVTKPLPPNVIAAGVPAKVIRKRFPYGDTEPSRPVT